jgi:hypothetical protein
MTSARAVRCIAVVPRKHWQYKDRYNLYRIVLESLAARPKTPSQLSRITKATSYDGARACLEQLRLAGLLELVNYHYLVNGRGRKLLELLRELEEFNIGKTVDLQ